MARTELDARIRTVALERGAQPVEGARAVDVERDGDRVSGVVFDTDEGPRTIACRRLVVADGARSTLGRVLGRVWHRDTAYGVAARAYVRSGRHDDEWISSHLELRGTDDEVLSGYGWVFPLHDGHVNIGVGTLATEARPANVRLRSLIAHYAEQRREDWQLEGEVRDVASALLPMGGAVSGVSGPQLGAGGRRRRAGEPAQRRGHRLRPGERADRSRACSATMTTSPSPGRRRCAASTARRSRSPGASPGC